MSSKAAFDAVELSLFASRVAAICEEMGALLGRVAFSPNIRDRLDYSCALFNRKGQLLGQATHIPVHLGTEFTLLVEQGTGKIQSVLDVRRERRPSEDNAHFIADGFHSRYEQA